MADYCSIFVANVITIFNEESIFRRFFIICNFFIFIEINLFLPVSNSNKFYLIPKHLLRKGGGLAQ